MRGTSLFTSGRAALQSVRKGHRDDQSVGDLLCRVRTWRDRVRECQSGGALGIGRAGGDGSNRCLGQLFMAGFSGQLDFMTPERS